MLIYAPTKSLHSKHSLSSSATSQPQYNMFVDIFFYLAMTQILIFTVTHIRQHPASLDKWKIFIWLSLLESGKRLINRYYRSQINGQISPEVSFTVNRQGCFLCLLERDRINDSSNLPSPQQQDVIFRLLFEYERNKDYQEILEERRSVDLGRQFQHSLMYALFGHLTFSADVF